MLTTLYGDVVLFRRGFISGLLCQAHKSDYMFNKQIILHIQNILAHNKIIFNSIVLRAQLKFT